MNYFSTDLSRQFHPSVKEDPNKRCPLEKLDIQLTKEFPPALTKNAEVLKGWAFTDEDDGSYLVGFHPYQCHIPIRYLEIYAILNEFGHCKRYLANNKFSPQSYFLDIDNALSTYAQMIDLLSSQYVMYHHDMLHHLTAIEEEENVPVIYMPPY